MTVRETPVRTMLAPRASANPYSRSIHQSVSLRASHAEARVASTAAGMRVPVCGMHSSRGAEPRRTVSHGAEDSSSTGANLLQLRGDAQSSIMYAMASLWFESALLPQGWARGVRLSATGAYIERVTENAAPAPTDERHAIAVPGLPNLHSHAFQRGLAGLTERRGPADDSFWTWRELMYRFVDHIDPDEFEAISALAFAEMLEGGFTQVGEFHYLHHDRGGVPFADPGELAGRLVAAASHTGIGLTLLPTFYAHGGFGGAAPTIRQRRFINDPERFARIVEASRKAVRTLTGALVGVAPHSLRAVTPEELGAVVQLAHGGLIHIHIAEQSREVEECVAWSGRRPVECLLDAALAGGRQVLQAGAPGPGRAAGLVAGALLDVVGLASAHPALLERREDEILDGWIFAGGRSVIDCVWRAGVKVVSNGRHHDRDAILARYARALQRLRASQTTP